MIIKNCCPKDVILNDILLKSFNNTEINDEIGEKLLLNYSYLKKIPSSIKQEDIIIEEKIVKKSSNPRKKTVKNDDK